MIFSSKCSAERSAEGKGGETNGRRIASGGTGAAHP